MSKVRELLFYTLLMAPLLMLVLLFEMVPLFGLLFKSFQLDESGQFGVGNYVTAFTGKFYLKSISNSLWISFVSSLVGIVIALFGVNALYRTHNRWVKGFFLRILNMTSNFAGIPLAFAFMILLGNSGFLVLLGKTAGIGTLGDFQLYSSSGMIINYIYFQIPLACLLMFPTFDAIKKEYIEASILLNAKGLNFWRYIGLPIILPGILGTFSILFANAIAAYATAYALLGSNFPLLPVRISAMFIGDVVQRPGMGSALSMILLSIMTVLIVFNAFILKKMHKV
ncbi:MAG: ABC transporter permease subunit [Neisseria sp.]|nr:ABC transporter permease subunit [Neisseria sp.]